MWTLLVSQISAAVVGGALLIWWMLKPRTRNPFSKDERKPRKGYVHDQKERSKVLKQGFSKDKVPEGLDAILIGSGIGSLTTAAIMAKAGKKVLVLEQHDQAGGTCHSYTKKGYEFDVGIHYVGEMGSRSLNKTLLDQISDGQIEWAPLDDEFDIVQVGHGNTGKTFGIASGFEKWKLLLKSQFPDEHVAIDKYFALLDSAVYNNYLHSAMKVLPLWIVKLLLSSNILKYVTNLYSQEYQRSNQETLEGLTSNKDLQTVLLYCWGAFGCPADQTNFTMQAMIQRHMVKEGAYYPVGGGSEIAHSIVPVIQRAGGKVLVRANVTKILAKKGKVCGVRVTKGSESTDIWAPMVISSAGMYNTFQRLLPKELAEKSYYTEICRNLKPGVSAMNVFLGLNQSATELSLPRPMNMYAFTSNNCSKDAEDYMKLSSEDAMETDTPLLYISFPSTKDPEWVKKDPSNANKSTCQIITLSNWEWFKEWENSKFNSRGEEYTEMKEAIGHRMIEQTLKLFPQLRDAIDFIEIGSPVTNKHYLGHPHGEIYGLNHSTTRFDPLMIAKLRPKTDIPGLFLTGQDVFSCGFTGAMFAGAIAAQECLERMTMLDLLALHFKL